MKFQNENLLAEIDQAIHAIVPDPITIIDYETASGLPIESLDIGNALSLAAKRELAPSLEGP